LAEKTAFGAALLAALLAALFCARPGAAGAQTTPLDEKARYERSLEQKVDEVLLKMIGPSQAKVVVEASMDFTRTEKVDMTSRLGAAGEKDGAFKWDAGSTENQMTAEYLLPGFPNMASDSKKPENTTYQKQMIFPATFLKKLVVTVILNKELSDSDAQSVRSVVSEVLALDQKRGDDLVIIRAPFAPFWRTIWYTPEAMGMIFKYGVLAIMGIIALIVVAVGFLKLAAAMNTMAKSQQSHQITMDVGKELSGMSGGGGGAGELKVGMSGEMVTGEKRESDSPAEGGEQEKVVFSVRPDQVVFLVHLMAHEDPANVALVANHLAPEVRSEFLRLLPAEVSSEVLSHMAKVRFIEPDVVNTIKEELERRLNGTVGGVQQVIEVVEKVNLRAKMDILEKLFQKDPETASLVRKKVLLPEDMRRLSERDMSLLVSDFKIETLASALWELPRELKEIIRKQMAVKTWQMVEQTMKYGAPSKESSEQAVEELVGLAVKLIKEGRIANPLEGELSAPAVGQELSPPPPPPPQPPAARLASADSAPGPSKIQAG